MADTTITMSPSDVNSIIDDYAKNRAIAANITVELSGVNELDPLVLLRVMSIKQPGVDDLAPVCEDMLDGRTIKFKNNGQDIFHPVVYNKGNGNSLHLLFTDAVYLYDILQQTVYALLLKKLTPHLEGSN
jgi:hypothetical protein